MLRKGCWRNLSGQILIVVQHRDEGVPVYSLGTGDIGWVRSVNPTEIIIVSVAKELI